MHTYNECITTAKDPEQPMETTTNRVFVNLGAADEEDSDDAMDDDNDDSKCTYGHTMLS